MEVGQGTESGHRLLREQVVCHLNLCLHLVRLTVLLVDHLSYICLF